ncbi:MAG: peroxide stress protein YaaA [Lachnospiraceae bacterium]|nr:peroxide stress protein YaaA [Lachnospiraceae bacterium]
MKIIISPAKKMEECQDIFEPGGLAEYMDRTERLYDRLKAMTESELQAVFKANDQITRQNYERYQTMNLKHAQTPALLSYVGIQYQYMAPKLFSYEQWEYVKRHLRILSGFYGILRPDERVTPYRLEMQAKLAVDGAKDLYEFWGRSLYDALVKEEKKKTTILNLASKEYSKAIEPYLTENDRYITCIFGILQNGKIKVKATEAKMARGEMVRYMAERKIEDPEEIKSFDCLGYRYADEYSTEDTFVYIKN